MFQWILPLSKKDYTRGLFIVSIAIHLTFLLSLQWGFLNQFFNDASHRKGQAVDFFLIYQAGKDSISGEGIYESIPKDVPYSYQNYRYLPISSFTLGILLSIFSPWTSYWVWIICCEVILILLIILTKTLSKNIASFYLLSSMWLCFSPLYLEFYMGQFTFFLSAAFFIICYSYMKHKERMLSIIWVVGVVVKFTGLLLVPLLFKYKKYKTIVICLSILCSTTLIYFYFHKEDIPTFLYNVSNIGKLASYNLHAGNLGLQAFLGIFIIKALPDMSIHFHLLSHKLLFNIQTMAFALVKCISYGFIIFSLVITFLARKENNFINLFSLWVCTYLLSAGEVWEHHFVLIIPALIFLYLESAKKIYLLIFLILAIPTPFILFDIDTIGPQHFDPEKYWPLSVSIVYHAVKISGVIVLFICSMRNIFRKETMSGSVLCDA
jgi:hypothetical protein